MPDYQNGKIYKLWSPQGDEIYIGSTTQPLYKRLSHHKGHTDCSSKYLFKNYDVVKIELLERFPCDNREELTKKEGEYIRGHDTCLNRCIAGRTQKEYYQDNKEDVKEYKKEYRENNKEYIKECDKKHAKKYRENNKEKIKEKFNCECGGTYRRRDKLKHFRTKKHIDFMNSQQDLQTLA